MKTLRLLLCLLLVTSSLSGQTGQKTVVYTNGVPYTTSIPTDCSYGMNYNGTDFVCAPAPIPSGTITIIVSGACPTGYTEVTALNGKTIIGTLAANNDVGTTGGSDSITPTIATLTAAAQTFTGSSATSSAVSGGTPAGTNSTVTGPAQVISWPVGVPAFTGSALGTHTHDGGSYSAAAQPFTGSSATSSAVSAGTPAGTNGTVTGPAQVISWPAGVPTNAAITAGTPAGTIGALTTGADSSTTGGVAKAIAQTPVFTGSALGTHTHVISWPAGVPTNATSTIPSETFTGSALGTHTHTLTATGTNASSAVSGTSGATSGGTPAGTVAWPVGVPTNATSTIPSETFTGSALGTHTHTVTATGTNGNSAVTGTLSSFDNRSAWIKVIPCSKT